jgi:hypothetical protein
MYPHKTRVIKEGTRWCVERRVSCGVWERYPMRFGTRSQARDYQFYWARA